MKPVTPIFAPLRNDSAWRCDTRILKTVADPGKEGPEWHSVDVVTGEVTALPDPAALEQTDPIAAGHDPYNRTELVKPTDDTVKVRTLDDLRRLSDEIKQGEP
jgi:hypothetical protein